MNQKTQNPFNIELLNPTPLQLKGLIPTKRLDIYEGITNNFHNDGFFSTLIFGRVGSIERDTRFSYIDIKTSVLHPAIYQRVIKVRSLYEGIMSGRQFAVWDPVEKDFLPSNIEEGDTGYSFFISKWKELNIKLTDSIQRANNVALIEENKEVALIKNVLVMPAGLRDLYVDDAGRTSEDEINKFYRETLATANTIVNNDPNDLDPMLDNPRFKLQISFLKIYEYLENMISGKKGMIQQKWGSRRVFNGTRNVISPMDTGSAFLGDLSSPKLTDAMVGLFQIGKAALPLVIKWMQDFWLSEHIGLSGQYVNLTNKETLMSETVLLENKTIDKWGTKEGLEKILDNLLDKHERIKPIDIEGRYLGLVYEDETHFKVFSSLEDIPEGFEYTRDQIKPMNLTHLVYLSGYNKFNNLVGTITRYPVEGMGSIFPVTVYVKTTMRSKKLYELNENWEKEDVVERLAIEYPSFDQGLNTHFLETLVPHTSRLKNMGADFDGDTCSFIVAYTEEARTEVLDYLTKFSSYITPSGGYYTNVDVTPLNLTLRNMSK